MTHSSTSEQHVDLIVIGAGSGNSLIGPEFHDKTVALLDDGRWFGGTCLNAGCIPTKMFVHVADVAAHAADAPRIGLSFTRDPVDWLAIRDRVFAKTDKISRAGFRYRDEKSPNVTVFRETFRFDGPRTLVSASGVRLSGEQIVIAAGSRPRPLEVPHDGDDPALHTSDSIMRIDALPASLTILGGGAVAVEFAHVFSALGVRVTLVARSERLLTELDHEISERFTALASEHWSLRLGAHLGGVARDGAELVVSLDGGEELRSELVLVAQGRIPNADRLGAASAGYDLEADGRLAVDHHQRALSGGEPVAGVYGLGDVSSMWELKHVANHEARIVEHNLAHPHELIGGHPGPVPSAIFSRPQIAHFGLTEEQARRSHPDAVVVVQEYRTTAYGWALEDVTSICKLVVDRETALLLGAHIVGPEASILIQPLIQAASQGLSIRGLARGQYWPHPAASEVVENALLKAEEEL
ncbi:mycothione reductase [Compostimonas suwonensis]|uniref:Mycothione reductase n=1 Tax=Compostimonas suwonensis TaxID=1048394 RepID=A0A2M9BAZ3_9MICO|nr:mycothione reductase [Compostimonas suwonensis]PJJ55112.1 mycothione reductase [Compostimonas suwonensis]